MKGVRMSIVRYPSFPGLKVSIEMEKTFAGSEATAGHEKNMSAIE
jgi:hypothetical protein